ncbi:MAG: family 10 glycosylhydrolase, partial [Planctomycetota bacterium]|nr:family 10 glycosylhydrolase [Planctomycetota bacterium]
MLHILSTPAMFLMLSISAEEIPLKVGVFDTQAAGGQGASISGLIHGLKAEGFEAGPITDLHMLTLLEWDVIYLSDMHKPGRVHQAYRKTLMAYVYTGGSVLQTWHHHLFGNVGLGVRRVYGSRKMQVVPGHPAVAGIGDFNAFFKDHIVEKLGSAGKPLLRNEHGDVVAAAGQIGKGKVISTGLALAIPNGGRSQAPRGAERTLLKAFLKWLKPAEPTETRQKRALVQPRLEVSAPVALTAAGYPASFAVRFGSLTPEGVVLRCKDARISERPASDDRESLIRSFDLLIATQRGVNRRQEFVVKAEAEGRIMQEKITVESVHGDRPESEMRGVWLHVREDRHPKVVMPELKKLGINMAVLRIAGGTAAFYASKVQPDIQDPLGPMGDWLAESARHAKANGIELHPYVNNCIVEGRTSKASLDALRKAGRLQVSHDGRPIGWFCPSQEMNVTAMEKVMVEIATRYDVAGVQYDFIRYPNEHGCFCSGCRTLFEEETGNAVEDWPKEAREGPRAEEWTEFRCTRISAIVERISSRIRKEAPQVKISAAVFRDWPDCRKSVGQDWVRWCKEGWLDFVCPMNYTLDSRLFAERAAIHRIALPKSFPIVQGIGIA